MCRLKGSFHWPVNCCRPSSGFPGFTVTAAPCLNTTDGSKPRQKNNLTPTKFRLKQACASRIERSSCIEFVRSPCNIVVTVFA